MTAEPLECVAMGCDEERHICTGGDTGALLRAKATIQDRCQMPGTGALPSDGSRWQFPRYFAQVAGASFYYDYNEIFETQTGECESPFRLVACQDAARDAVRKALRSSSVRLGGCGYVRDQRGHGFRWAGCHLNVSYNAPGHDGCRTAMVDETVQQVMLFFLATNQPWESIGLHHAGEWQARVRAIATDVSNSCSDNRGLLQPGRPIPAREVKEQEVFHYTHYESGLARSQYQRALAAAVVTIDLHLACHHAPEVAARLADRDVSLSPDVSWLMIKRELNRTFAGDIDHKVAIGSTSLSLTDALALRLDLYDWLLPEASSIPWVSWAVEQIHAIRSALLRYKSGPRGPLLGLDSIVKRECVYRPLAESRGLQLEKLWGEWHALDILISRHAQDPEARACMDDLFGYNLLYHDFGKRGLYEDILDSRPDIMQWHRLPHVAALRGGDELPLTRARRRHRLAEIYADISSLSNGRLTPCFAGFDRIALQISNGGDPRTQMHYLKDVLCDDITAEDVEVVRRMAGPIGVDVDSVLRAHGVHVEGDDDARGHRSVA